MNNKGGILVSFTATISYNNKQMAREKLKLLSKLVPEKLVETEKAVEE